MKRILILTVAVMAATLGSCVSDDPQAELPQPSHDAGVTTIFAAYPEAEVTTRAEMADIPGDATQTAVTFKAGDMLQLIQVNSVISGVPLGIAATAVVPFSLTAGIRMPIGLFTATGAGITTPGDYIAVHPGVQSNFSVTTGSSGYISFQIPTLQTQPAIMFDNAEDYMCFYSEPVNIAAITSDAPSVSLQPLTSVIRFHVRDAGGYTTGKRLKSISMTSVGANYFASTCRVTPAGVYINTSTAANMITLDIPGTGVTLDNTLSTVGCIAVAAIPTNFNQVTGYRYLLTFHDGSWYEYTNDSSPLPEREPGKVYETPITVNDVSYPKQGVLAPPGVVGITAVTNQLTVRGSKEYAGTNASTVATTSQYGPLSDETVYTTLFKWGSLIALGSDIHLSIFSRHTVLGAPDGYDLAALLSAIGNTTGQTAWLFVPNHPNVSGTGATPTTNLTSGTGDICKFVDGYNGNSSWKMTPATWTPNPAHPYYLYTWDGLDITDATLPETSVNASGTTVRGRRTTDWSMFLPYAYARHSSNGLLQSFNTTDEPEGLYWTGNAFNSGNGIMLSIRPNSAQQGIGLHAGSMGLANIVRCVRDTYTITYHPNGGTGEVYQVSVPANTPYTIQSMGYTRYAYSFDGYNTQSNGLGFNYLVNQTITVTQDMELYAKWSMII